MIPQYHDHHLLAIYSCCTAVLELLHNRPDIECICEMRTHLEEQHDVIDCLLNARHYGSDGLDEVISSCNKTLERIKEAEEA